MPPCYAKLPGYFAHPCAMGLQNRSRSAKDKYRGDRAAKPNRGIPPAYLNQRAPTGGDTPHDTAVSSLRQALRDGLPDRSPLPLMDDNYFCRHVLPQQRMLPDFVFGDRTVKARGANRLRKDQTSRRHLAPLLVRTWPCEKPPGWSSHRRPNNSFAVRSGSDSSQAPTRGHIAATGSLRVRQCRGRLGPVRCVGRTSPFLHALAKAFRRSSESALR